MMRLGAPTSLFTASAWLTMPAPPFAVIDVAPRFPHPQARCPHIRPSHFQRFLRSARVPGCRADPLLGKHLFNTVKFLPKEKSFSRREKRAVVI
jgi:hypothetical protein